MDKRLPGPASSKLDAFLPLSTDELPGDASGWILDHLGGTTEDGGGGGASSSSPMTAIRPHVPLLGAIVVAAGSFAPVHPREADFADGETLGIGAGRQGACVGHASRG